MVYLMPRLIYPREKNPVSLEKNKIGQVLKSISCLYWDSRFGSSRPWPSHYVDYYCCCYYYYYHHHQRHCRRGSRQRCTSIYRLLCLMTAVLTSRNIIISFEKNNTTHLLLRLVGLHVYASITTVSPECRPAQKQLTLSPFSQIN